MAYVDARTTRGGASVGLMIRMLPALISINIIIIFRSSVIGYAMRPQS